MQFRSGSFALTLLDEPTYSLGSSDNLRNYDRQFCFADEYRPSSICAVVCNEQDKEEHSCILLASGGRTAVHEHSAVIVNRSAFVAVGDRVCSLSLPSLDLHWATRVDSATCFGIHYSPKFNCLVSHGELEIARLSLDGEIIWTVGGRDIFSESFRLFGELIEAVDFNREVYRIDIANGQQSGGSQWN